MSVTPRTKSFDANAIADYLAGMKTGVGVTVREIQDATKVDLRKGFSSSSIQTAKNALFNQERMVFQIISGQLYRLSDEEKITEGLRLGDQADRRHRKAAQVAMSVDDYDALSASSKSGYERVLMKSKVMASIGQMHITNKVIALARANGGVASTEGGTLLHMIGKAAA
jgi:hypothetical protein